MKDVVTRLPLKKEITIGSVGVNETVGLECLFSKSNRGLYDISVGASELRAFEFTKGVRAFISSYPVVYKKLAEQVMDTLLHRLALLEKALDIHLDAQTREQPNRVDQHLLEAIRAESFRRQYLFEKRGEVEQPRPLPTGLQAHPRSKFACLNPAYLEKVEAQSLQMSDGLDYMHQEIQSMDTLEKQIVVLQYAEKRRRDREERLGKSPEITGKESTTLVDNYFRLRKMIHKSARSSSPPVPMPAQEPTITTSRQSFHHLTSAKRSFKTFEPPSSRPRRQLKLGAGAFFQSATNQRNVQAVGRLASARSVKKHLSRNSLFITKAPVQGVPSKPLPEASFSIRPAPSSGRIAPSNVLQANLSANQSIKISQSYQLLEKERSMDGTLAIKNSRPITAQLPKRVTSAQYLKFK